MVRDAAAPTQITIGLINRPATENSRNIVYLTIRLYRNAVTVPKILIVSQYGTVTEILEVSMDERVQAGGNDERGGGIQVIARAAKILNVLGRSVGGMSLGEIAQAVDLPRSTVQRIVGALEEQGMIRIQGAGGISLGAGLLRLVANAHVDRMTVVRPWLHKLSERVQETVVFSRPAGIQLIVEDRVVADRELQVIPRLGQLDAPLYGTSAGRALLALDQDEDVKALFATESATKQKTTVSQTLLNQLDDIRKAGVSSDHGELIEGITTTAVALDTVLGRFAISMPIPTLRFEKNRDEYIEELLICKAGLLKEIGIDG
ncbi:IclR family transcriptional regulator [Pseudomonas sp. MAFF 302030]|uniref:IclR family transcriptional regulator n=1 Tax=Pseudomonas morbosilactucae TaxID=2938197 RepID=A0A9X1YY36_9PSED|nr:IclR family transcriptional regulator [Pseudomonas morbosilactucae]MCK9800338.1 IclR family transcriptional regulator [Pseudomonas morbosilactucae]